VERSSGATVALDYASSDEVAESIIHRDLGAGHLRRLFCIWNRGYKTQHVIAVDIEEALGIAREAGHTRRGHRRWKDETEGWLAGEQAADGEHKGRLEKALAFGKSGIAKYDVDRGWSIGSEFVEQQDPPAGE
jgi:hypothetical protein